jgi:hypothetical protein
LRGAGAAFAASCRLRRAAGAAAVRQITRGPKFHWFGCYDNSKYIRPNEQWRCDLHPRFSRDGRSVVIDSPYTGGRQLHLMDVSAIIG